MAKIALLNVAILLMMLIPVEIIFGNWIRPIGITDLKRFTIPIGVAYEYDVSGLYESDLGLRIRYTRDQWGLRGTYRSLAEVDLITVGGSTTDQKFVDDSRTWQAHLERELVRLGSPLKIANAGVDGQSTVGHLFTLENWLPLLPGLKPKYVLFYLGVNDVLKPRVREQYDGKVDASSWRVKSATWNFLRTLRGNLSARAVQVSHRRKPQYGEADFTDTGMLAADQRQVLVEDVVAEFMSNVEMLRKATHRYGALPVFVTQTAFAWNAGGGLPRGLTIRSFMQEQEVNFADISIMHQAMNRRLLEYCVRASVTCFDLASEVAFDATDYYDLVHHSPTGTEKIGRYLARKLASMPLAPSVVQ